MIKWGTEDQLHNVLSHVNTKIVPYAPPPNIDRFFT